MIKSPTKIREWAVNHCYRSLDHFRLQVSCYAAEEQDILKVLENPNTKMDVAVALVKAMLAAFGHTNEPAEPRFDATRRAVRRKVKGPRGVRTFNNSKERKKALAPIPEPIEVST